MSLFKNLASAFTLSAALAATPVEARDIFRNLNNVDRALNLLDRTLRDADRLGNHRYNNYRPYQRREPRYFICENRQTGEQIVDTKCRRGERNLGPAYRQPRF